MASEIKIYCKNLEEYVEIRGGESMLEVSRRLKSRLGFDPICVTVNNKVRTLRFEVFAPVQVEFFARKAVRRAQNQHLYLLPHRPMPGPLRGENFVRTLPPTGRTHGVIFIRGF